MSNVNVIYQNKWCRIINKDTFYVLQSKSDKYNDQYFQTLDKAYKAIGIDMYNHNFKN